MVHVVLRIVLIVAQIQFSHHWQIDAQACERNNLKPQPTELEAALDDEDDVSRSVAQLLQVSPPHMQQRPPLRLHFLFMATDNLPHLELWKAFFDTAPVNSWQGWVHCVNSTACAEVLAGQHGFGNLHLVPTVPSSYCTDLLSPAVQLLRSALEATSVEAASMDKFVLVSDSALPTKPFQYIHDKLASYPESDICMYPPQMWPSATINGVTLYLIKSHEWFVLNREHAETLVRNWSPPDEDGTFILAENHSVPGSWTNISSDHFNVQLSYGSKVRIGNLRADLACGGETNRPELNTRRGCTDELGVMATIFGAFEPDSNGERTYPGYGTVSMNRPLVNDSAWVPSLELPMERPVCHTFVRWTGPQLAKSEPQLYAATETNDTEIAVSYPCDSSPLSYKKLGPTGQAFLRNAAPLFVRKVSEHATYPGYAEMVF